MRAVHSLWLLTAVWREVSWCGILVGPEVFPVLTVTYLPLNSVIPFSFVVVVVVILLLLLLHNVLLHVTDKPLETRDIFVVL